MLLVTMLVSITNQCHKLKKKKKREKIKRAHAIEEEEEEEEEKEADYICTLSSDPKYKIVSSFERIGEDQISPPVS